LEDQLFLEKQSFRQIWLWILLITIDLIHFVTICTPYFTQSVNGIARTDLGETVFSAAILIFTTVLFYLMRLETVIKSDGIYYRFFPFQIKLKKISWEEISQAYIRKYNPIMEYGGWGIRNGFLRSGKAYNVSGNEGLQMIYTSNKRFLLGTKKANEIKSVLSQLGKLSDTPKD
jgi:hypothetical protein